MIEPLLRIGDQSRVIDKIKCISLAGIVHDLNEIEDGDDQSGYQDAQEHGGQHAAAPATVKPLVPDQESPFVPDKPDVVLDPG